MRKRQRPPFDYTFAPVPVAALERGRLNDSELRLLCLLYRRADWGLLASRRETPRLTLAQIAEEVAWPHGRDALSKALRRLRDDGWFEYRTERLQGKRGGLHVYSFLLKPEPEFVRGSEVDSSEASRGGNSQAEPVPEPAEAELVRGFARDEDALTQNPEVVRVPSEVSEPKPSEVSEDGTRPAEPDLATSEPESVRGFSSDESATPSESVPSSSEVSPPAIPLGESDSAPKPPRARPTSPEVPERREPSVRNADALGQLTTGAQTTDRVLDQQHAKGFQVPSSVRLEVGDVGYRDRLRDLRAGGEITQAEMLGCLAEHGRALRAGPPDEQGVLDALDELVAAGVGRYVQDAPTRALCSYPAHRDSDWLSDDGRRLVCGVCHSRAVRS